VDEAASTLADAQATLADDTASGASSTQLAVDQTRVQSAQDSLTDAQQALAGATLTATTDGTVTTVNVSVGEKLGSSGSGGTDQTGSDSGTGNSSSDLGSGGADLPNGDNGSNGSDNSSTPDLQVVSTGKYSAELQVDSSQVDRVRPGAPVTVSVSTGSSNTISGGFFPGAVRRSDAGTGSTGNAANANGGTGPTGDGTTVTGIVYEVGKVADASSGVARYPVTIAFSTDDASFSIGTSITGDISSTVKDDAVQVPVRAVSTSDGRSTVTVALDGTTTGRTETVEVTTGESAGGQIEITSGLDDGQQVIVENVVITGGGGGDGDRVELPGGGQLPAGGNLPVTGQFPGGGGK
jgi:macrolide-specific efflux system membrane fusion protein